MKHIACLALATALATPALAQSDTQPMEAATSDMSGATAALKGADGAEHGTVTFEQTPSGLLITAELTGLPPGEHGFHVHTTGACEPPFQSAGGHFNPTDASHGYMSEGGPHAGDLPNIFVPDSGELKVQYFTGLLSLEEGGEGYLLDDDGSAILVHAHGDDYRTDPSGESGDRIACGVIE